MSFTIDEKGRLIYLRQSDDKNQAVVEADERTIGANRKAYEEFLVRIANAGAPVIALPPRIQAEVAALRTSGLKKAEAKRHADEGKRLDELAKPPKRPKAQKVATKRRSKKRGR